MNVIDPNTGAAASRQNEINFEAEYLPMSGPFENLHVQLFYFGVRMPDDPPTQENQPQIRGVLLPGAAAVSMIEPRDEHSQETHGEGNGAEPPRAADGTLRPYDARMLAVGDCH